MCTLVKWPGLSRAKATDRTVPAGVSTTYQRCNILSEARAPLLGDKEAYYYYFLAQQHGDWLIRSVDR